MRKILACLLLVSSLVYAADDDVDVEGLKADIRQRIKDREATPREIPSAEAMPQMAATPTLEAQRPRFSDLSGKFENRLSFDPKTQLTVKGNGGWGQSGQGQQAFGGADLRYQVVTPTEAQLAFTAQFDRTHQDLTRLKESIDDKSALFAAGEYLSLDRSAEMYFQSRLKLGGGMELGQAELRGVSSRGLSRFRLRGEAEQKIGWTSWVRSTAAINADTYFVPGSNVVAIGPRAGLEMDLGKTTKFGVDTEVRYRPNDWRTSVLLNRALGYQVSVKQVGKDNRFHWNTTGYLVIHDNEALFSEIDGATIAFDSYRRLGLDLSGGVNLLPWLAVEGAVGVARGTMVQGGATAPFVPTRTARLDLVAKEGGFYGRIGMAHAGERFASSDGHFRIPAYVKADSAVGFRHSDFEVELSALNLFNSPVVEAATTQILRADNASACTGTARPVERNGAFVGCEDMVLFSSPLTVSLTATLFL